MKNYHPFSFALLGWIKEAKQYFIATPLPTLLRYPARRQGFKMFDVAILIHGQSKHRQTWQMQKWICLCDVKNFQFISWKRTSCSISMMASFPFSIEANFLLHHSFSASLRDQKQFSNNVNLDWNLHLSSVESPVISDCWLENEKFSLPAFNETLRPTVDVWPKHFTWLDLFSFQGNISNINSNLNCFLPFSLSYLCKSRRPAQYLIKVMRVDRGIFYKRVPSMSLFTEKAR